MLERQTESGSEGKTALLVVDLQQALCNAAPSPIVDEVIARISQWLDWAEAQNWPIVFVQHATPPGTLLERESDGWQLAPALRSRRPALLHEKCVLSSFEDGKLHAWLKDQGVSRLCITGMQTEYCITAACEGAAALGYDVILPIDAHMTIDGTDKLASQIIAEANAALASIAHCAPTASLLV